MTGHGPNCLRKGQSPIMTRQPLIPRPAYSRRTNRPTSPTQHSGRASARRAEGGQEERVGWYRQHAAGTHPSQGAGQEGHARRRLGPEARASPPPPACDNKQYRSRPEAQQKARHLREEDTGAFQLCNRRSVETGELVDQLRVTRRTLVGRAAKAAYAFSAWETWRLR